MGSVEEGGDGCGETGAVPRNMAPGDGINRTQRRGESTKEGRN